LAHDLKLLISPFMAHKIRVAPDQAWETAESDLLGARQALLAAPPGIARKAPYMRLITTQSRCTELLHGWMAQALGLERVRDPRMVLSLDVDGVLEDEQAGFSSTGLAGAAALRLLQLGNVAVLLNTARALESVRDRVRHFRLLGGVGAMGAVAWDGVFEREEGLMRDSSGAQLHRLRTALRADSSVVLHPEHDYSVRASRISDGRIGPISGTDARGLLDRARLNDLAFWVAPRHTDFVDRSADKGAGIKRLTKLLGLDALPMAAMGDGACDVPMLRQSAFAFLPAATLPSYVPPRRQRLVRSRNLGDQAVWDAACSLVPNPALQRQVLAAANALEFPEWFPEHFRRRPSITLRFLPRLAAAFSPVRRVNRF
jgi:3-deoxy-D-manno-octulosonate 8-phosphate phosphatase KdsC-like HAD superfamily phosphatase